MSRSLFRSIVVTLLLTLAGLTAQSQHSGAMKSQDQGKMAPSVNPDNKVGEEKHGIVRTYFIAADEVDWDYTPHGRNIAGLPRVETTEDDNVGTLGHRVYRKAIYREYTDATFKTLKPRPAQWEHLGILGPLIRAEVGDSIRITFRNNTHLSVSMHPHGLEYKKDAEGASYNDGTVGAAKSDDRIAPGKTYTYIWTAPERSGPAEMDESSVLWMYHSHFVEGKDINTGLVGPIIVTARGKARPDGSPRDVDKEFITDFSVFDETESWFFERNASRDPGGIRLKAADPLLREKNLLYSINGYIEGNLPLLTMKRGERIRWYLLSNGNEDDVHMAHWHGNTVVWNKMRMDSIFLGPMAMASADMVPDNIGTWLFHCHVTDHFNGGMVALYQVLP
ncbi:multicopper oxidase domain-containing protein [Acidicapsa ligni]|uniref:multicopper oxidase domain-containing protein n=1 Tax=Acidicapsa ligni TaxID=542300 RepID=UPI0021E08678|nr:multicopper oxidase domain-containing protein [Acidicapsa ligni]